MKDPVIVHVDGEYRMVMSYHLVSPEERRDPALLKISDTIATGMGTSNTGLAVSDDGRNWRWVGDVLAPTPGRWDSFCARVHRLFPGTGWLRSLLRRQPGRVRKLRGARQPGLLSGPPSFSPLETSAPLFISPYGAGSVRYVEPLLIGHTLYIYYEFTRPDGGHQLRVAKLPVLADGEMALGPDQPLGVPISAAKQPLEKSLVGRLVLIEHSPAPHPGPLRLSPTRSDWP